MIKDQAPLIKLFDSLSNEVKYQITSYPDGQQNIRITQEVNSDFYEIRSRFNSFKDLELILCMYKSLRRTFKGNVGLHIPHLLGARCDRAFEKGDNSYLKDVIAPILNAQKFHYVRVYDVHNERVADACIDNLILVKNTLLVKEALTEIQANNSGDYVLVFPDKGAAEKAESLCKEIGYFEEPVICSKKRDIATGEIVDTQIGNVVDFKGRPVVIIDDICDGGRTFIEIAERIRLRNCGKMYLIISHAIFSAGLSKLATYFNGIYCTNSVQNIDTPEGFISQLKVI